MCGYYNYSCPWYSYSYYSFCCYYHYLVWKIVEKYHNWVTKARSLQVGHLLLSCFLIISLKWGYQPCLFHGVSLLNKCVYIWEWLREKYWTKWAPLICSCQYCSYFYYVCSHGRVIFNLILRNLVPRSYCDSLNTSYAQHCSVQIIIALGKFPSLNPGPCPKEIKQRHTNSAQESTPLKYSKETVACKSEGQR